MCTTCPGFLGGVPVLARWFPRRLRYALVQRRVHPEGHDAERGVRGRRRRPRNALVGGQGIRSCRCAAVPRAHSRELVRWI